MESLFYRIASRSERLSTNSERNPIMGIFDSPGKGEKKEWKAGKAITRADSEILFEESLLKASAKAEPISASRGVSLIRAKNSDGEEGTYLILSNSVWLDQKSFSLPVGVYLLSEEEDVS